MHEPDGAPNTRPGRKPRRPRGALVLLIMAIGPGVLGLAADNDAGGMLSYLVTGASRHLDWFVPALFVMAPITYLIQELALRVALATRLPYGKLLTRKFGRHAARLNGLVLYALNLVILMTEFLGMAMALGLIGVPWTVGLALSFGVVLAITSWQRYQPVERLLLWISVLNLIFIPAVFLLHPSPASWVMAFSGRMSGHVGFLLLSLAGNAMAPWMIYWQQNAVWAGNVRTLADGRKDIRIGVLAQVVMASVVLLIGALAPSRGAPLQHPLIWLSHGAGPLVGDLFAIGIFNAGFLAACTISLSSAWMLRESWGRDDHARHQMPTRGGSFALHGLTLVMAALGALVSIVPAGALALWAQALGALWMPVSVVLLGLIAADRHMMGPMVIHWRRKFLVIGTTLLFLGLALLSFLR